MKIALVLMLQWFSWNAPAHQSEFNSNPIVLDSRGQTSAVFLQPDIQYRFELYAPGSGHSCNGRSVGQLQWIIDRVYDAAVPLEKIKHENRKVYFFDKNGNPAIGHLLCTFRSGTHSTPIATIREP